ncbi:cAMP-regulated D2 protein [Diplonema papillatum]|nr:cAMP-regulated D2 protein [Diplonema papillatum]
MLRAVLAVGLAGAACGQDRAVTVDVAGGSVTGYAYDSVGSNKFLGIPYAEPPVGALRWANPVPNTNMGHIDAKALDVGCPQECLLPPMTCPPKTSEDCLFLNVFTPTHPAASSLPVLFFIHGGDFFQGYGGGVLYDGSYYANQTNTVFVSINYRLGVLGFLSGFAYGGNYGLEDQRVALRWVQTNIARFGGDPGRVTIIGQSAGAMSAAFHLVNPGSADLFHQAIMMSEPFTLPFRPPGSAEVQAHAFARELGCGDYDVACMASRNTSAVMAADLKVAGDLWTDAKSVLLAFCPWVPTINQTGGGWVDPTNAMYWGNVQDKPVIMGNVANEGRVFIWEATRNATGGQEILSRTQYDALTLAVFREKAGVVHARYPPNGTDNKPRATTVGSDYIFVCATRKIAVNTIEAKKSVAPRKSPVYHYLIDRPLSFGSKVWIGDPECFDYTCHGGDLPFSFPQMRNPDLRKWNITYAEGEVALAAQVAGFYSSFAHGEQPVAAGASWPALDPAKGNVMHLTCNDTGATSSVRDGFIGQTYDCDWWDTAVNMYNINGPN